MMIKLTITGYQTMYPGQVTSAEMSEGVVTIGRSKQCTWRLHDPKHLLSRQHCVIESRGNDYYLTDTSANGTYLNAPDNRISEDNPQKLHNGDRITLGEYEISISIEATHDVLPGTGNDSPVSSPHAAPDILPTRNILGQRDKILTDEPIGNGSGISQIIPLSSSRKESPVEVAPLAPENEYFEPPEAIPDQIIPDEWWKSDTESKPEKPQSRKSPPYTPPHSTPTGETNDPLLGDDIPQPDRVDDIPASPTAVGHPPEVSNAQAVDAFLRGANLKDSFQPDKSIQLMENAGMLLRITTQQLCEILAARGHVKSEFGLEKTSIGPTANNPLKALTGSSGLTIDDVLVLLLAPKEGFMPPLQALAESFNDIKSHELAVMAGMQNVLRRLLKRFDPNYLEVDPGKQGTKQKARSWDLYIQQYTQVVEAADEDFKSLFGQDFAHGYQQHSTKQDS